MNPVYVQLEPIAYNRLGLNVSEVLDYITNKETIYPQILPNVRIKKLRAGQVIVDCIHIDDIEETVNKIAEYKLVNNIWAFTDNRIPAEVRRKYFYK